MAVPLCVPAQPAGSEGLGEFANGDTSEVAARAEQFSFSTCLQLLEDTFSKAFSQALSQDSAISASDAYFNLGAFAFSSPKP